MHKTHLTKSWGFLAAIGICLALACSPSALRAVQGATPAESTIIDKVVVRNLPFNDVVRMLAMQSGLRLVMRVDNATPITLNFPDPTPVEEILKAATAAVDLEFWKNGDTYVIGKRAVVIDPQPLDTKPAAPPTDNQNLRVADPIPAPPAPRAAAPAPQTPAAPPRVVSITRRIDLKHLSGREAAWMFGVPGISMRDNQPKRRIMKTRIETVLNPRKPVVRADSASAYSGGYGYGDTYASPALPTVGSRNVGGVSATDGRQIFGPGPGQPGQPAQPAQPAQPVQPVTPVDPNDPNATNAGAGGLAGFLPKGIDPTNIVGLIGLNALLVKATGATVEEAEEAINQLEQLLKLLDQPVKQVIVEVMFVKMEVKDAMSIGSSWEFAGLPLSITSMNGGAEGNFGMRYIKGNLKLQLATLITNTRAKVVNAPRVVVQNGGSASIQMEDSIPFIIVSEEQDVFGRSFETPEVEMQTFAQGLDVNEVTIHPDNSVTLDVTPVLEAPGAGVGIPGGGGEVLGGSSADIQTIVRVKNGETIMMGGFVSKNETMGGTRDPLLASLPVVGPLFFRNNSHSTNSTETLVFVTPTIMEEDTTNFEGMATLPPLF